MLPLEGMKFIPTALFSFMLFATPTVEYAAPVQPVVEQKQLIDLSPLIDKLALCESGKNALAENKVDHNGKASRGMWQFQDLSWKRYLLKYKLYKSDTWPNINFERSIWNDAYQHAVVTRMFVDPDVDLTREFPDCSKLLHLQKNYYTK